MEIGAVLSDVRRLLGSHRRTPQSTLDVGGAGRVWALDQVGVQKGISFQVQVEGNATVGLLTDRHAGGGIVRGDCVEPHIVRCAQRGFEVLEDQGVPRRSRSVEGQILRSGLEPKQSRIAAFMYLPGVFCRQEMPVGCLHMPEDQSPRVAADRSRLAFRCQRPVSEQLARP